MERHLSQGQTPAWLSQRFPRGRRLRRRRGARGSARPISIRASTRGCHSPMTGMASAQCGCVGDLLRRLVIRALAGIRHAFQTRAPLLQCLLFHLGRRGMQFACSHRGRPDQKATALSFDDHTPEHVRPSRVARARLLTASCVAWFHGTGGTLIIGCRQHPLALSSHLLARGNPGQVGGVKAFKRQLGCAPVLSALLLPGGRPS